MTTHFNNQPREELCKVGATDLSHQNVVSLFITHRNKFKSIDHLINYENSFNNIKYTTINCLQVLHTKNNISPPNFQNKQYNKFTRGLKLKINTIHKINTETLLHEVLPAGIIIDSGSTTHVFKRAHFFTNWDKNFDPNHCTIMLASGNVSNKILGRGTVEIRVIDSNNQAKLIRLLNVLYMPSLNHEGLISTKQLMAQQKAKFMLDDDEGSFMILEGYRIPLRDDKPLHYINLVQERLHTSRRPLEIWHAILGHPHHKAVVLTEKVVRGMSITGKKKAQKCTVCIRGKHAIRLNKLPDLRATRAFEWIHSDVAGPYNQPNTTGDMKYLVTFVCDYSGYLTVYPIKNRSQVVEVLKDFLIIANQLGTVCKIRCDNAKEYVSDEFKQVCRDNYVQLQTSAPYTPSQNGTAERSFRTLGEKQRCLLQDSQLPNGFWPQAAQYAAHLYNRTFSYRIKTTPFQLAHGKPPNLARLMRFGQNVEAYVHKRYSKLCPRTKRGRFVGIDKLSSADLVYFEDENLIRSCAHTIPIDETGTQSVGVREHDDHHENSVGPNTVNGSASGRTRPPQAVTPEIELPDGTHPNMVETGSLYTPSECGSDDSEEQPQNLPAKEIVSRESCGCPQSGSLNSEVSSHDNYMTSKMYADGKFRLDQSSGRVRPVRDKHAPVRYGDPVMNYEDSPDSCFTVCSLDFVYSINTVPRTYRQAMESVNHKEWSGATGKEFQQLIDSDTFERVDRPRDTQVLTCRWVFSIKLNPDGSITYKARLCARGFDQEWGVSYNDTYAPMSRMTSIRTLMFLCAQYGFIAHQMDVTAAYLNAPLDHEIYMEQPPGYDDDKSKVWRLNKSLYGLKQSARLWNETIHSFFIKCGFQRSNADLCLYRKAVKNSGIIFVVIWVDDIVIVSNHIQLINEFKQQISTEYKVKDLGPLKFFLGIEFSQEKGLIQMSQSKYSKHILERFGMMDCNPEKVPCEKNIHDQLRANKDSPLLKDPKKYRELVGSLIYLEQVTRPDLSYVTNLLGQQMADPTEFHWKMGLKVLRYLKGTQGFTLNYRKADLVQLTCYADADWGNNALDRKSQSGYLCYLHENSSPVSWSSRKQNLVATSTCNAEYVALSEATCEVIWLQKLLTFIN